MLINKLKFTRSATKITEATIFFPPPCPRPRIILKAAYSSTRMKAIFEKSRTITQICSINGWVYITLLKVRLAQKSKNSAVK